MNINRKNLLTILESVLPGVAEKEEGVQQSSCFVFKDGKVMAFNEEVFTHATVDIGISGAIPATPLISLLKKLDDDELIVSKDDSTLIIKGKNKKSGIVFEKEIALPVDTVELPSKKSDWREVPSSFWKGLDMVRHSCSSNDLHFGLRCVHVTSKFVEACDNAQVCRYATKVRFDQEFLIRYESASAILPISEGLTTMTESKNWIHFSGPSGLMVSIRRYMDKYPQTGGLFEFEGQEVTLPKDLSKIVDKASIFTSIDKTSVVSRELVEVSLDSETGRMTVRGNGSTGWYKETKNVKYKGPSFRFLVSPETLSKIANATSKAHVSEKRMMISEGNWKLLFVLYNKDSAKESKEG